MVDVDSSKRKFWKPGTSAPGEDIKEERIGNEIITSSYNPHMSLSIRQQREQLPIFKHRTHVLYCVEHYQTTIIVGETGSGKSTQVPQYLLETGYAKFGYAIAVSQPRRVACVTLASRVADERGSMIGREIGYKIRFDDCWDENETRVKFVTDGMLIREIMNDPILRQYSVIMLDEAHERSLQTDMALGLMKKILKKRKDLRVIISSATLDAKMFHEFFNTNESGDKFKDTAIIMPLEGRSFPVDVHYLTAACQNYVQETVDTIAKIHKGEPPGDVLAFLTGADEIDFAVAELREISRDLSSRHQKMMILPMHGSLPANYQMKVFQRTPQDTRKIVLATNIAEASITINGIVYVVDCGYVKLMSYNPKASISSLVITKISQASAVQRAGRAGRVRAGKVYRLYTESEYDKLSTTQVPDMQRSDLSPLVLQMKALGIVNIVRFDYISKPPAENMLQAVELLYALGALDNRCALTQPNGERLAEMPLHPMFGRMLLASADMGCAEELLTIAAMTQIQNVFVHSANEKMKAEKVKRMFTAAEGDHLTLLNVFNAFDENHRSQKFCRQHYLNYKGLLRALSIRQQLRNVLSRFKLPIESCNGNGRTVRQCITKGIFVNAAKLHHTGIGVYRTVRDNHELHIHPTSVLYREVPPQWVVFNEIVRTNKEYMQDITVIEPEWLYTFAGHFYEYGTSREISEKRLKTS
ncbi:probable ATP-dependent RNA helicase DHX35 isoform X2 [Watersipora subatra]|uniref:probable ATP-dependent RNA helicase DHX35 isoform X2 n=1 Tax=Watersipora subatra TaxID=2589382 RepID=UPI00355B4763